MGTALTLWAGHISKGCPMHQVSPTDWKWGDSGSPQSLSIGHHAGHARRVLHTKRLELTLCLGHRPTQVPTTLGRVIVSVLDTPREAYPGAHQGPEPHSARCPSCFALQCWKWARGPRCSGHPKLSPTPSPSRRLSGMYCFLSSELDAGAQQ